MPSRCKRRGPAIALAASLLALASPALADQFKESADGGTVACSVSARELTRFALIGDQFASVSKISSGYPYNDFAVTHEPVRGDIYVSVPETFAANRISFFATTKAGYVYKFSCSIDKIEAAQVFITNPALAKGDAGRWEGQTGQDEAAVRLVQAMAGQQTIEGFEISQPAALPSRIGALEVQLIAEYRGAALAGKVIRLANRGTKPLTVAEKDLAGAGALAVSIARPTLEPGAATTAYLVGPNAEQGHD
ncbi:type-F conjugative transfer system secretin TraK [Novosphingobium sp. B1]|uniref:type-F conjugative transfer system secretin TraK n=1 Tax=Novosphingobium sp. B1 TaxID=1938756 RepID=UPI0009D8D5AD|nr:type-F conjugative transfer system secretin TraK [Novosphingobium sp. B1]SMC30700.1 conjugal transfer pilus assembly protein TraK [Novosphingobium sp. B1]